MTVRDLLCEEPFHFHTWKPHYCLVRLSRQERTFCVWCKIKIQISFSTRVPHCKLTVCQLLGGKTGVIRSNKHNACERGSLNPQRSTSDYVPFSSKWSILMSFSWLVFVLFCLLLATLIIVIFSISRQLILRKKKQKKKTKNKTVKFQSRPSAPAQNNRQAKLATRWWIYSGLFQCYRDNILLRGWWGQKFTISNIYSDNLAYYFALFDAPMVDKTW